jgi:gamma-glutamylcysteine synthetase
LAKAERYQRLKQRQKENEEKTKKVNWKNVVLKGDPKTKINSKSSDSDEIDLNSEFDKEFKTIHEVDSSQELDSDVDNIDAQQTQLSQRKKEKNVV